MISHKWPPSVRWLGHSRWYTHLPSHPIADGCQSHSGLHAATQMADTSLIEEVQHEPGNVNNSDGKGVNIHRPEDRISDVPIQWVGESLAIICHDVRKRLKKT